MFTQATPEGVRAAADMLRAGHLVAFPTETVYGLGADARVGAAVAKIYQLKSRPTFNPLIIHVLNRASGEKYAEFDDRARSVADAFWPGPLTLVLPLKPGAGIDPLVTAGLDTVAVRVPAHTVARDLLREFGGPVAAPSANRSGRLSPTTALHVAKDFGADAPFILAGNGVDVGVESTILDLSVDRAVILRPGGVTADDLSSVLGYHPDTVHDGIDETGKPKSPGLLLKHYAPRIPVRLRAVDVWTGEALLAFGSTRFMGVAGGGFARDLPEDRYRNLSESGNLNEAARHLFRMLHDLDRPEHIGIAVMDIPEVGLGLAINDRLRRASRSVENP